MALQRIPLLLVLLIACLLGSCQPSATPTATPKPESHPSQTPLPPTDTPLPLAAIVDGEPILLEELNAEILRYTDASGTDLASVEEEQHRILRALIERLLLAQGAREMGLNVEASAIDQKIDDIKTEQGGEQSFQNWLAANHFDSESFRDALAEDMHAAMMVEFLVTSIPETELQVHAAHILVAEREYAEGLWDQVVSGQADFENLALNNSLDLSTRLAGGDLGWFPKNTLTTPALEEAAFSMQPGEVSEVIETKLGFHILKVIEVAQRPLPHEALVSRRRAAVETWLENRWEEAFIEIIYEP